MLKLKLSFVLITILTNISIAQHADIIIGKYRLPNKLDIEIFKTQGKYSGKIISLNGFENGQQKDLNNPDKIKQKENLLEKVIINNLEFDEDSKNWVNGTMYAPEKGLVFDLRITEIRQNDIEIIGSKYFFKRTLFWKKI